MLNSAYAAIHAADPGARVVLGGLAPYGDARAMSSPDPMHINQPMIGIGATPTGKGYWLFGGDGGVFTFGVARYKGSAIATLAQRRTADVRTQLQPDGLAVAIAAAPRGDGYWIATRDGGVFAFGSAHDYEAPGGVRIFSSTPARTVNPDA